MKKATPFIAIAALLLPILARWFWFYPGIPSRPEIATPDYPALTIPQAPLETPVTEEEPKVMGGIALLDYSHANQFQPGEIQVLKEAIEDRGGKLEFGTDPSTLENSLKYASAYVVISPSIPFSSLEISLIRSFVQRGGRLAVFTDATRGTLFYDFLTGATIATPDINAVNPLLSNFGISVNNDYLYNLVENEGNFRNVYFDEFGKDELTFGLKQVAFYGTHSVESDLGVVLFPGAKSTLSSLTDAHDPTQGGAALSADGNVAAFGDFTFLTSPYNTVADNSTLIANLADFLLGGERMLNLKNFPYVFSQQTLNVFPTSEVQMTAELIAALGRLQSSLGLVDMDMQIAEEKPVEGDVLALGTYTPSEDLEPFLEPFDLAFEEGSEFVEFEGFGKVGQAGNGMILFEPGKRGNTVVLLAVDMDGLTILLDTLSSGSLFGCLLQEDRGICNIGFGGSFSDEPTEVPTEVPVTETPVDGSETPTPVPTPGG